MASSPSTGANPVASAGDWRIVPARSELGFFTTMMLGLMRIRGRYSEYAGELHVDDGGVVRGELDVDSETIATGINRRDKHLRSKDFFHVEAHPRMRFELTGLAPEGESGARLSGTLHIRDRSLPIDTPVTVTAIGEDTVRIDAGFVVDHHAAGFEFKRLPKTVRIEAALTLQRER